MYIIIKRVNELNHKLNKSRKICATEQFSVPLVYGLGLHPGFWLDVCWACQMAWPTRPSMLCPTIRPKYAKITLGALCVAAFPDSSPGL